MKTIDWREKYINYSGTDVTSVAKYLSKAGSKLGTGTRENPYNERPRSFPLSNAANQLIIGSGSFDISTILTVVNGTTYTITGQSKADTILEMLKWVSTTQGPHFGLTTMYIRSLYIKNIAVTLVNSRSGLYAKDCIFDNIATETVDTAIYVYNSIVYKKMLTNAYNCTFVDIPMNEDILKTTTPLLSRCEVNITQANINTYYSKYIAFNACKFQIGSEASSTSLTGNNADELRQNFVDRCTAQGIVPKSANDDKTNTPVDRWIFSNTSISGDYHTILNSEIDTFAHKKGIYFGHTDLMVNEVRITNTKNIPGSIDTETPKSNMSVSENSIALATSATTNNRIEAYADSKIIWLGGLKKLTSLSLTHNLSVEAGIYPDSTYSLAKTTKENIKEGNHYLIRSNDDFLATVKYDNVEYTSSLVTRNNVFLATATTTFDEFSGNAEIYQILDFANHQTLQIRLIRQLPKPELTATSGSLQAGYWYFVEPLDLEDTTASVTYKGIVRPAFDSFLVDSSNLTYSGLTRSQLRRCWKQDFDYENETTDKSFWADKQKPYYFDVVTNDLRCLLKNDSSASVELETIDNKYVGSGHPEFYNKSNAINGTKSPAYNLVGAYLQIRVPITTKNMM